MTVVGQPISTRRRPAQGDRRRTLYRGHSGRRRRHARIRLQHGCERPDRFDRHCCRRKSAGRARRAYVQKHAAHEPAALEPSAPSGTNLPAAPGPGNSLRGSADWHWWLPPRSTRRVMPARSSKLRTRPTRPWCLTCARPRRTPSSLPSACGRSSSSVGNADKAIADAPSKLSEPLRCPTGITTRWSRTRPWRSGTTTAR